MSDFETIQILREIRKRVLDSAQSSSVDSVRAVEPAENDHLNERDQSNYGARPILDHRYFDSINRFDIAWAKTMFIFENIRPASTVLDLGCGAGLLSLLKRKGVMLIGVGSSIESCEQARRSGYNEVFQAESTALPFPDASFDYVVMLDAPGQTEAYVRDAALSEIARVLKPDGETLHVIELPGHPKRTTKNGKSAEELSQSANAVRFDSMGFNEQVRERFQRQFPFVQVVPGSSIFHPVDQLINHQDGNGTSVIPEDFANYLRRFDSNEKRAFNMAMGYAFVQLSEAGIDLPTNEFVLVKAAKHQFRKFYRSHPDPSAFTVKRQNRGTRASTYLDRHPNASFGAGWYSAEVLPPIGRWMARNSSLLFKSEPYSQIRLSITTHMPDLGRNPLEVGFWLNGEVLHSVTIIETGWFDIVIDALSANAGKLQSLEHELEIKTSRTWSPRYYDSSNSEVRDLSIAVCNIELIF